MASALAARITASRIAELEKFRRQQEREAKRLGALVNINDARRPDLILRASARTMINPTFISVSDRSSSAAL